VQFLLGLFQVFDVGGGADKLDKFPIWIAQCYGPKSRDN